MAMRPNAAGLGRDALSALLATLGEPAWRGGQLFSGLLRQRWTRWEQFSTLSKALRARLETEVDLAWPTIIQNEASTDGSTKHVFELADGRQVEGVFMPYFVRGSGLRPTPPEPPRPGQAQPAPGFDAADEQLDRVTLCISSQVGCAMGCTFCATGQMGIIRNLSAAEIVGQVVAMLNHHSHPLDRPVNLVFMGMGEPLHNFEHLMAAFETLTDAEGLAIPPRRITVSTAGLEDARRLVAFARRFPAKVNLIPFNPHEGSGFEPPDESRVSALCRLLAEAGLPVSVRRSRGQDVSGACGQLVREGQIREGQVRGSGSR